VKPVFTSSKAGKKGFLGGADLADIANSRQKYDMSFLGSKAKDPNDKPEEKLDAEGNVIAYVRPVQERPPRWDNYENARDFGGIQRAGAKAPAMSGEDDFEVVVEKKRVQVNNSFGSSDMAFGKPMFTRSAK